MPNERSNALPADSSSALRPSARARAIMSDIGLPLVARRPGAHQMLAKSARAAAPVHVKHPNEEVARLLRLDHVMGGENPRHVPDLKILLNMRERFGEAFVAGGKI